MTAKLQLSADTVLVKLYGSVTGVTRRAEDKGTTQDGQAVETRNLVTTRQADASEAERARKLLHKLRAIVDSYTTTVLNLSIARASALPALREEVGPVQEQIEGHNRAARFHRVDRALIMVPVSLQADPAAITEVCRQICDELKTARSFFNAAQSPASLDEWLAPVDNWRTRTRGLGGMFPTVTGQVIGEAIQSVSDLRAKVANLARAKVKAGRADDSALREALREVAEDPGALGLIDSAVGLTAIVDTDSKEASDAIRAESAGVH